MRRLVTAALALLAVGVVAGSALAASGNRSSVIFDSTSPNGAPTNEVSYGPAAYKFNSIGDKITFGPNTARSLTNVTVTLSSWACEHGTWFDKNCVTTPGATFSQPITMKIYDPANLSAPIAESTQTFDVAYRPSLSTKCVVLDAAGKPVLDANGHTIPTGKWMTPAKECKNGITDDVTFNSFTPSNVTLPGTVVYAISYDAPADPSASLNVAVTNQTPSAGTTDNGLWINGELNPGFDGGTAGWTPAVQFKAGNAS